MKKIMTFGVLTLLALNLSMAQENATPRGPVAEEGARFLRQLKLSDQQRKDIDNLRFDLRKKSIDQQAKLKTERLELAQLFKSDTPNESAVEKKVAEISQLQAQQRMMFVDHWFAVNKLLTPDQQKVWKKVSARILMHHRARSLRARASRFMGRPGMQQRMRPAPGATGR